LNDPYDAREQVKKSMPFRSSSARAPAEELMKVDVDVSLKEREGELLREGLKALTDLAPAFRDLGVTTKLVLLGAGAVFEVSLSLHICHLCSVLFHPL
jgi:hypothetical protein